MRNKINRLWSALEHADAVVIGAGAGLSASAGFTYTGERFEKHFSDFAEKYENSDRIAAHLPALRQAVDDEPPLG